MDKQRKQEIDALRKDALRFSIRVNHDSTGIYGEYAVKLTSEAEEANNRLERLSTQDSDPEAKKYASDIISVVKQRYNRAIEDKNLWDHKEDEDFCFVATAVYGDSSCLEVRALRALRDGVLEHNPAGRLFVDFYYSGAGKAAARALKEYFPQSIPAVRKCLDVVVDCFLGR